MQILIDGYNLLHQSDLMGRGKGADWLRSARRRLIATVGQHLPAERLQEVAIVFDRHSKKPIEGVQRDRSGIAVYYAINHPEADDLIEELIAQHPHAKTLTVVSSDHRLQTAAKRRGATFVDSDVWYDKLVAGKYVSLEPSQCNEAVPKPDRPLSDEELDAWMEKFEADKIEKQFQQGYEDRPFADVDLDDANADADTLLKRKLQQEGYNPFPEGYAEDL